LLKVGLTGGIASGKSIVAGMFAALGVHVVEADRIAHQLLQPNEPVYAEVVRHFGTGILNRDGTVNRSRLAELAFASGTNEASRIKELNQIIHPAVIEKQEQWMDAIGCRDPNAIAMVEAALIVEAGAAKRFDDLIVVTCRPEQRIQRWAQKQNTDNETARLEVTRRMAAQLPDQDKIKLADFVVDNSGPLSQTQKQVGAIYEKLTDEARAGVKRS
jgi:dephospho-CoA kinase